ncbi:hemoglobin-like flavoprotein [Pelomonas saccharophila]|uniref:Hemoglobin-like flavoprotein n=1 Tax=Roseateles saccharophilus TaxID=304 RepID=A0ABU1YK86_ROSSA|nr:globin family protein [Roseateles saccharophilus]MDR7269274.1 hemoglobin-like flavoprotein [Roseateles saccharophilus]
MTPQQIDLIRSSFEPLKPLAPTVAEAFYAQLFARDPALRALFRGSDMSEQGTRLMQMLSAAIELLDRPHSLNPVLLKLGQRHAGYGVVEAHYASVGAALLDTLSAGLGQDFTPEVREAWTTMYGHVAKTMQEGAATEALAA